jgi:hypothetical protein
MTKFLVETKGNIMLWDFSTKTEIHKGRPTVVPLSNFINRNATCGNLKVLATDLPDTADDAEFAEYWAEASDIAVEAYLSQFENEPDDPRLSLKVATPKKGAAKGKKPAVAPAPPAE